MNQKSENDPDQLGGIGDLLSADALERLKEVLKLSREAGANSHGSKIELVYVASGGQHVETQINIGATSPPNPLSKGRGGMKATEYALPEALCTEKAIILWKKAQDAGWIDANYQPLISRTQSALLADAMAERLGIREKWKVFEALWNRKNMYRDYYKALNLQQSLTFQDKIKRLFR
jgi:hypothetical protein